MNIKDLKNKHKDKRCFVIGTGPSLTKEQIDKVRDEITISMSGIIFAKDMWNFEPTYLVSVDFGNFADPLFWEGYKKSNSTPIISKWVNLKSIHFNYKFTPEQVEYLKKSIKVDFINKELYGPRLSGPEDISLDLSKGIYQCGTGIQDLCIPLASWLGCDPIYLLGCDCNDKGHYYEYKTDDTDNGVVDQRVKNQYKYFAERIPNLYNLNPAEESCPGVKKITWDTIQ